MEWSETYGGSGEDWARSVIHTSDGGFAIAGLTHSYGAGEEDFWLVKTDSEGRMEWSEAYGGSGEDWAWSVIQTSDGGFAIAGLTHSYGAGEEDFWLEKTDGSGRMELSETYGGPAFDGAHSVIQTSDGGFAIAGGTESYGAGGLDFWLVKTDGSGRMEWSKTYGGSDVDGAESVVQTSDGGFAIAGATWSYSAGEEDFWLVKLSGKDPVQYTLTSSANPSEGGSITLDPLGGTYDEGTEVTATANPAEGYGFDHWSGDYPEGRKHDPQIKVTMDSDKSLTAHFVGTIEATHRTHGYWLFAGVIVAATIGIVLVLRKRKRGEFR